MSAGLPQWKEERWDGIGTAGVKGKPTRSQENSERSLGMNSPACESHSASYFGHVSLTAGSLRSPPLKNGARCTY